MSAWLSPDDPWPSHKAHEVQDALAEARDGGWWFRKSSSHTFGRLRCMPVEQAAFGQVCSITVASTSGSSDGSTSANIIRDEMRRCTHDRTPPSKVDVGLLGRTARRRLAEARALLDATESFAEADAEARSSLELLSQAEESGSDELLEMAAAADEASRAAEMAALGAAAAAGAGSPWPPPGRAEELLQAAEERIALAEQALAGQAADEGTIAASAELEACRTRVARIRAEL